MYIIKKVVHGKWSYWWNQKKSRWEGIVNNAEKFPEPLWSVVDLIDKLRLTDADAEYSYKKVR